MKNIFYLALPLFFLMAGCSNNSANPEAGTFAKRDTSINAANAYNTLFFDSAALEKFISANDIKDTAADHLRSFYSARNYQYAWFSGNTLSDFANTFLGMENEYIDYSKDSGLYNPKLQQLIDSVNTDSSTLSPADSIILKTELSLTVQFFHYTRKAYQGKKLDVKDLDWYIPRKKINIVATLDSMLAANGKNVQQFEPVNRQYGLLKNYLLRYYAIQKKGGWETVKADKKSYREGDSADAVEGIKKRLFATNDLVISDSSNVFTPQLTEAVKHFEHSFGLKEDGIVSTAFITQMNKTVDERINQLLINMERVRWMPANPTTDYILVNIPEFKLHAYENGNHAWDMNVVVGKTGHNTVIFTGNLKYIVFSPYWNVPPSIIKAEILPGMQRNKNYLAEHNMEWNNGAVRQKPGPKNSLGLVKFLFPNEYNIYLHDSPAKSLFAEDSRAFSHGCIRLSEPKKLAVWLLRKDSSWTDDRITKVINGGKEQYVTLNTTIPVFIGYFTAWVDRNGQLNFRDDIYGHDDKMAKQLFANVKK